MWSKIGESSTGAFHVGLSIWKADGLSAGAASIVITGIAGQGYYANFSEFSPLAAVDKTADAYTFGSSPAVGPTATTVDAVELVIAAFTADTASNGGATTASGYTSLVDNNTTNPILRAGYKITSSTGTQSASWGTLTAADQYAAFIVTIKDGLTGPPITTQPTSVRTSAGQTATFNAAATGATSQKWQSNATGSWVDISGATSTSYTTPTLAAGTAYAVRIIFSDGANESISDPADVWTPAVTSLPWRAVRIGSDLLRSRLLLGSSVAALRVGEDILLGQAASGGGTVTLTPSAGHLTLTGRAPSLTTTLAPGKGALTLTGYAPSLARTTVLTPSKGSLTFTGYAPSLSVSVLTSLTPSTGHLVFTGKAPTLTRVFAPSAGHLAFTGYAPSLAGAAPLVPGTGHLTFTGYAPSLVRTTVLTPSTGHLVFTGYAPAVVRTTVLTPSTGSLTFSGKAPGIALTIALTPGTGHLSFTGYAPAVLRTTVITPAKGALVFTGRAPSLTVLFPGGAVYPTPDQVLTGVQYGPSGADYTGALPPGTVFVRRR